MNMKKFLSLILAKFVGLSLATISVGAEEIGIEFKGMPLNRLTLDVDINDVIGGSSYYEANLDGQNTIVKKSINGRI